jgi:hypothetical protein
LALPVLQVLLGFRYEPAAYYQGLPRMWTKKVRSGKCGFGHHERKTKKKIGIIVHVGALMDLIVPRSAGFSGCVAWSRLRPGTSRL